MDKLYKLIEKMQLLLDDVNVMIKYKKLHPQVFFAQDEKLQNLLHARDTLQKSLNEIYQLVQSRKSNNKQML
jgi:hypothetical protein